MATESTELPHVAEATESKVSIPWLGLGLAIVIGLSWVTRFLEKNVPTWVDVGWVKSVEFPVYAIALGLLGSAVIGATGIREKVAGAVRTELFIKTGIVLLGASVHLHVIAKAGSRGIVQALLLVAAVFFFTWWLAGRFKIAERLRALLATAVSICGVSAAIAAAGAVRASKEQIAYTATLVILFALPSIFLLPWLATALGLSQPVAGAWIGGNIDTTAAVAAAGAIVGEEALKIAAIVKSAQNVLMGVAAVALTVYFTVAVERKQAQSTRAIGRELWVRFPKFVIGFVLASLIATFYLQSGGDSANISAINTLRSYFLIAAFVSIGLEFRITKLMAEGWRPVLVFGLAAIFNLIAGLVIASLLFSDFAL
jgi:uncharacterized integral membrane protein (TIGR00698 family)